MSDEQEDRWRRQAAAADAAEIAAHGFTRVPSRTVLVDLLTRLRREAFAECSLAEEVEGVLRAVLEAASPAASLRRRDTEEHRAFWDFIERSAAEGRALLERTHPTYQLDKTQPAGVLEPEPVCEHGTAMDVHCCGCHSGFLFDASACTCLNPPAPDFWRCLTCGCLWRDNHDETVSLASAKQTSCSECEMTSVLKSCEPLQRMPASAVGRLPALEALPEKWRAQIQACYDAKKHNLGPGNRTIIPVPYFSPLDCADQLDAALAGLRADPAPRPEQSQL